MKLISCMNFHFLAANYSVKESTFVNEHEFIAGFVGIYVTENGPCFYMLRVAAALPAKQ